MTVAASSGSPGGSLAGQVALVTGAGRGIGRAIAEGLSAAGASVGLVGRTRTSLEEVAQACTGATTVAVADVTQAGDVQQAVDRVEDELGPIDLLVNNAGQADAAEVSPWAADPGDWWSVVETNLRGPMHLCRAVVPGMVARRQGRIININSGIGLRPAAGYSAYSVSKAALSRLTDCLALQLRPYGPVVFDLSPGLVRTDMTLAMPMWDGTTEWTPASAVVDAVLTLASGRADALSGRFMHAARDDIEGLVDLIARAGSDPDSRTLRLRPYGDADPLA